MDLGFPVIMDQRDAELRVSGPDSPESHINTTFGTKEDTLMKAAGGGDPPAVKGHPTTS